MGGISILQNQQLRAQLHSRKVHKDLEDLKTQVNDFPSYFQDYLIPYLRLEAQSFNASQVSLFDVKWMQLTSDPHILCTIACETVEFSSHPIQQSYPPNSVCKDHAALVEAEIFSPKEKAVIVNPLSVKIRDVAKVICHLISSLPGFKYGALYYRNLEMDKVAALKLAKGNFKDKCVSPTKEF